jgi:hypothetical protein
MKTRVTTFTNLFLSLTFCLGLASCNKEDFYEKEFLENPFQSPTTTGSVNGGGQAGVDSGIDGGTQGGVDSGVNGGTAAGGTTGSSTTGGTDGSTVGGSTTGGNTTGGVDGSTEGGAVGGATTGGVDGSTTGGTTGVSYQEKTDVFHQEAAESKKLDILWVIDNSGSMRDEQEALGSNFSAFIDDFITKNVDFKMAITTTDTSSSSKKGRMVSGSDVKLTSAKAQQNEAQFKSDFNSLVKVGVSGSGNERGLEASEGFMQKYAQSFLRSDAYLAVVILSDEEDQSSKSVAHYTNYLKSFKNETGLVKVYSIVDAGMTNSGRGVTTGYQRYASASNNTAGIVANIRDDFHRSLNAMGDSIINLLDSFALGEAPVAGTLKVYIGGVQTTHFNYDAASRSIKFEQGYLPPVGAEIKVTYMVQI